MELGASIFPISSLLKGSRSELRTEFPNHLIVEEANNSGLSWILILYWIHLDSILEMIIIEDFREKLTSISWIERGILNTAHLEEIYGHITCSNGDIMPQYVHMYSLYSTLIFHTC